MAESLLALGESKQANQLIASENCLGLVQIRGNLQTKRALAILENAVLHEARVRSYSPPEPDQDSGGGGLAWRLEHGPS